MSNREILPCNCNRVWILLAYIHQRMAPFPALSASMDAADKINTLG